MAIDFKPKGPFPLRLQDLISSTPGWSDGSRFSLLRVLTVIRSSGGVVPDDDTAIAEAAGLQRVKGWRRRVAKLKAELVPHPTKAGFLIHGTARSSRRGP